MARISTYPLKQPIITDTIIGSKMPSTPTGNMVTSQFTVQSIVSLVNAATIPISNVGLNFQWSTQDPTYVVASSHIGVSGAYSKLRVDFDNLILESGSTYKLLIERNKRPSHRNSNAGLESWRKGGYKAQSLTETLPAPYTDRLSEIAITAVSGQLFDFKFDLFFRAINGTNGFPTPAGYSTKVQTNPVTGNIVKILPIAFRIQKTTGSEVTTSAILGELSLVGILSNSGGAGFDTQRITFKHR